MRNAIRFHGYARILGGLVPVLGLSVSGAGFAATPLLTEAALLDEFRKESVTASRAKAIESEGLLKDQVLAETYRPRLKASWGIQESHEKPLNQFQPVFSPAENWRLSVATQLPWGLSTQAEMFGSKSTIESMNVNDAAQIGMRVSASLDLWRNVAGRLDRARIISAGADRDRSRISASVGRKQGEVQIRKAFWELAANQLSIKLAQQLEQSAEKQVKEVLMRAKAGVADKGEVARYKSQRESRNGSLLQFRYERQKILEGLGREMGGHRRSDSVRDLPIDESGMDRSEKQVLACIGRISALKQPDLSATLFDDAINLLSDKNNAEKTLAAAHSQPTVSLSAAVQSSGVEQGYEKAREDWTSSQRSGNSVALTFDMPLAPVSRDVGLTQAAVQEAAISAERLSLENQLNAVHAATVKGIDLLTQGLQYQKANSKNLEESFKSMKSKYKQGRVPLSSLIFEQDSLFQSQLQEIQLKKQIAHAVLDYFAVFTDFDCSWNKI